MQKKARQIAFRMPKEEFVLYKKLAEAKNTTMGDLTKQYIFNNIRRNFNTDEWQKHFEQQHEKHLNEISEAKK